MKVSRACVHHRPYFSNLTKTPFKKPIDFGTLLVLKTTCFCVLDYKVMSYLYHSMVNALLCSQNILRTCN